MADRRDSWELSPAVVRVGGSVVAVTVGIGSLVAGADGGLALALGLLAEVIVLQLTAMAASADREKERVKRHKELLASQTEAFRQLTGELEQHERGLANSLDYYATQQDDAEVGAALANIVGKVRRVQREGSPIFRQLVSRLIEELEEQVSRCSEGEYTLADPGRIQLNGIALLESLESGDRFFATSPVAATDALDFWVRDHGPEYLNSHQAATSRGVQVTRVFILSSPSQLQDARVKRVLESNRRVNVDVRYVFSSHLDVNDDLDFGLFEYKAPRPSLVCYLTTPSPDAGDVAHPDQGHRLMATYIARNAPISEARDRRERILVRATEFRLPDELTSRSREGVDNDLLASAIAMEVESSKCVNTFGHREGGSSCRWYHQAWQYLRVLDMVETPRMHQDFFTTAIAELSARGPMTILLCGLADQEMLAVIWESLQQKTAHRLVVIDLCPTPLRATELWADRRSVAIESAVMDARNLQFEDGSIDLVITDAFLTKLPSSEHSQIVSEWRRVLVQDGHVLTTVKVDEGASDPVRASPSDIQAYAERAAGQADSLDAALRSYLPSDKALSLARDYATNNVSFPIPTQQHIDAVFEGFTVDVIGRQAVTEYKTTSYVQVFARRVGVG